MKTILANAYADLDRELRHAETAMVVLLVVIATPIAISLFGFFAECIVCFVERRKYKKLKSIAIKLTSQNPPK